MKKSLAAACLMLLTLTGCGNGDDDKAIENLKSAMMKDDSLGTKATEEQADCLSEGMVDELGVEKLQEYNVLDDDLKVVTESTTQTEMEKDDAENFAGVYVDCIDMAQLLTTQAAGSEDLTDKEKACIEDAVDQDVVEKGLAALFQGKADEDYSAMQAEVQGCKPPVG